LETGTKGLVTDDHVYRKGGAMILFILLLVIITLAAAYAGFCFAMGCVCRLVKIRLNAGDTSLIGLVADLGPDNLWGLVTGKTTT